MFSGGYFGSGRRGGEVKFYLSTNYFALRMKQFSAVVVFLLFTFLRLRNSYWVWRSVLIQILIRSGY